MTKEFNQIIHPDGSIEFRASNIEELEELGRQAAANSTGIPLTAAQVEESQRLHAQYQAREYLKSTDWYASRRAETGQAIPAEVLAQRQSARQLLSS
jgi:hypothetical protein